jgi:hypothetical protein
MPSAAQCDRQKAEIERIAREALSGPLRRVIRKDLERQGFFDFLLGALEPGESVEALARRLVHFSWRKRGSGDDFLIVATDRRLLLTTDTRVVDEFRWTEPGLSIAEAAPGSVLFVRSHTREAVWDSVYPSAKYVLRYAQTRLGDNNDVPSETSPRPTPESDESPQRTPPNEAEGGTGCLGLTLTALAMIVGLVAIASDNGNLLLVAAVGAILGTAVWILRRRRRRPARLDRTDQAPVEAEAEPGAPSVQTGSDRSSAGPTSGVPYDRKEEEFGDWWGGP